MTEPEVAAGSAVAGTRTGHRVPISAGIVAAIASLTVALMVPWPTTVLAAQRTEKSTAVPVPWTGLAGVLPPTNRRVVFITVTTDRPRNRWLS
jgi:hypothetical protein